jgi:hypothetical protein
MKIYPKCRFIQSCKNISLPVLKSWYNGYKTENSYIYNPLSVVSALIRNKASSYWADSGTVTQVMDYVSLNFDNVKEDVKVLALEQTPVSLDKLEYKVEGTRSRNEILSMLVAVGLLSFHKGIVFIPNKEVSSQYRTAFLQEAKFGYINRLVSKSKELVLATIHMESDKVSDIIEQAHMDESPLLAYGNESELMHVVSSAYIYARELYDVEREIKSGIGYADLIFSPLIMSDPAIIVELKAEASALEALNQLKQKKYHHKFIKDVRYTGPILIAAIGYDKITKRHACIIEEVFR